METKGKLIEDFEACEQTPQISILQMEDMSMNSISPSWAKSITESFNCKLDKSLIRTGHAYREQVRDEKEEKVTVSSLAISICEQLKVEPDKQLMHTASCMNGMGSMLRLETQACCKVLRAKFGMEAEY